MDTVNVFFKHNGTLHMNKNDRMDGLLLCVQNSGYSPGTKGHAQIGHFTNIAFNQSSTRFIASDHLGHLYHFNLERQRFDHLLHNRITCTALNYSMHEKDVFLMALADNSVLCHRIGQSEIVASLRGHTAPVTNISVHSGSRFAVTTDPDSTFLWDLTSFERIRRLSVKEEIQLVCVFFVPSSNILLTAFRDDTIFLWDSETLQCRSQLPVPGASTGATPRYRSLACSNDGKLLIAGGRARQIHVWSLCSCELLHSLELPSSPECSGAVRQVSFAEDQDYAFVLTHSGKVKILSLSRGSIVSHLENVDVSKFSVSKNNLGIISCGQLLLYDIHSLLHPQSARSARTPQSDCTSRNIGPATKIVTDRTDLSKTTYTVEKPSAALQKTVAGSPQKQNPEPLDRKKLRSVLQEYGQFPSKHRLLIWKTLLQLPGNASAFSALFEKGVHPAFENLDEKYPLRSQKLIRVMQRVLSCVAHWSPLFGEADFLPLLAFPFIRLFQNNQLNAFEALVTVLLNWAGLWFEYFPNPPLNVLGMVENLIAYQDKELYSHLCSHGITSDIFAWPLLQTVFTEVLSRDDWLALWDHLLCHHPGHLIYCAASFTLINRQPLFRMTELREFEVFYRHSGALNIRDLLKHARQIRSTTPKDICACHQLDAFTPLTNNSYPSFNRYPVYIVDYQVRERNRLRQEERAYLQERRTAEQAAKRTAAAQAASESWCRQQEQLLEAEDRRREMLSMEEKRLEEQRRRLATLQREIKMSEMETLQNARLRMTSLQTKQQEAQIRRLEDQLVATASRRDTEAEQALAQTELSHLDAELDRWHLDNSAGPLRPPLSARDETTSALSDLESVCADNSRLEEEVGALLQRLQRSRLQVPTEEPSDLNSSLDSITCT